MPPTIQVVPCSDILNTNPKTAPKNIIPNPPKNFAISPSLILLYNPVSLVSLRFTEVITEETWGCFKPGGENGQVY